MWVKRGRACSISHREKTNLNIPKAQEAIKVPLKMRSRSARKDVKIMINSLANAAFWQ